MKNAAINRLVQIICCLYILLFVYAATAKLLEFQNFQAQLGQSPLLSAYTGIISVSLLVIEFAIAILLSISKSRLLGLILSFSLMVMFTAYIFIVLNYSSYVPCSCGGILEKMNWRQHLIFNVVFVLLAVVGILLLIVQRRNNTENFNGIATPLRVVVRLAGLAAISIGFIVLLYMASDDIMSHENPFIRRYIQSSVNKTAEVDLNNYNFYIAGIENGKIYLGNNKAPLQVVVFDSLLNNREQHTIKLDRDDLPFRSIQIKVFGNYFYVFDGTVPVIFKGNTTDWNASVIMNQNHYFSKTEVVGTDTIIFTSRNKTTDQKIVGRFTFRDSIKPIFNANILQKQIDGIFDTDGSMVYSKELGKWVYLYSYRNQYTVLDKRLNIDFRANTIDTTVHANIKPVYIKSSGEHKLASQPYTVNLYTAVSDNLLFVNAALRGKYEDDVMWKRASIIDVYDIAQKSYVASFYIYNVKDDKLSGLYASGHHLYAIVGRHLRKLSLGKNLTTIKLRKNNSTGQ